MKIQDFQVKKVEFSLLDSDTLHEKKFHEKLKKSTGIISDFHILVFDEYNTKISPSNGLAT